MGHFGVKMKRSRDGGATWEERPVPKYPPKPEDVVDVDPMRGTPMPWDMKRVWALEGSPRDGELWCGTIPGGLFHSRDGGDTLAARREPLEPSRPQVRGSAAAPTIPASTPCSSTRAIPTSFASACRAAGSGSAPTAGESWDCKGQGHARRLHAARPSVRAPRSRTAPARAVRERRPITFGSNTTTASSAARTAGSVHGDHERAAVVLRLRRRRASRGAANRVVRARHEGSRSAIPSTARSSSRARATAARASTCCATACRSSTRTTSSIGTGSTSMPTALHSRSAAPQAISVSAKTRAIIGNNSAATLPPIYCVRFAN